MHRSPPSLALRSLDGIAEVTWYRGRAALGEAGPDLVLEVPHGATRASDYDTLRETLRGPFPDDLRDFFFVNTDVGAPEIAADVAARVVAAEPTRTAVVVRCLVPRTFVDCNRVITPDAAGTSQPGELTPGLGAWVRDPSDRALLRARHAAYATLVAAAFAQLPATDGHGVMVHTYAPRTVQVTVDEDIVQHLHAAYEPDRVATWPLRAEVDLITRAPDGTLLAAAHLVEGASRALTAAGFEVAENGTYALHPVTAAHELALRYPGRVLCLEVRRDLVVERFTPFAEMSPSPARVARVAGPLAQALARG